VECLQRYMGDEATRKRTDYMLQKPEREEPASERPVERLQERDVQRGVKVGPRQRMSARSDSIVKNRVAPFGRVKSRTPAAEFY